MKQTLTILILFLFSTIILSAQSYQLVKDFAPGTSSGWRDGSRMLDSMGSKVLFMLRDAQNTNSIWISDGTGAGTIALVTLGTGETVQSIHTWKGQKVIQINNASGAGRFLLSDGTKAGTVAISDFYGQMKRPVILDTLLYFVAKEKSTSTNTSLLRMGLKSRKVIKLSDFGTTGLFDMVGLNNKLYLIGHPSGVSTIWLLVSDGTIGGTKPVYSFGTKFSLSALPQMTVAGNRIFFYFGIGDPLLYYWYVTDGTSAGTKQLIQVKSNYNDFRGLNSLVAWKDKFYFPAVPLGQPDNTEQYYVSDGTPTGTIKLEGPKPYQEPSVPKVLKDKLYFHAYTPSYISDLFVTDGTAAGTTRPLELAKLGKGLSFSGGQYVVLGDSLYLNAYREETGWELWRTNGTTAGTVPIEWKTGTEEASPDHLLGTKNKIFMTIDDPTLGKELWVYQPRSFVTSSQEVHLVKNLLAFSPNPAHDQLQVRSLRTDLGQGILSIHNLLGQLVQQQVLRPQESRTLSLTGLTSGVYTLSLQQGDWLQVEKLVIK